MFLGLTVMSTSAFGVCVSEKRIILEFRPSDWHLWKKLKAGLIPVIKTKEQSLTRQWHETLETHFWKRRNAGSLLLCFLCSHASLYWSFGDSLRLLLLCFIPCFFWISCCCVPENERFFFVNVLLGVSHLCDTKPKMGSAIFWAAELQQTESNEDRLKQVKEKRCQCQSDPNIETFLKRCSVVLLKTSVKSALETICSLIEKFCSCLIWRNWGLSRETRRIEQIEVFYVLLPITCSHVLSEALFPSFLCSHANLLSNWGLLQNRFAPETETEKPWKR